MLKLLKIQGKYDDILSYFNAYRELQKYFDPSGYSPLFKVKKAIKQLTKAISLEPDSWEIQDHLGDAYLKDGNLPKAISSWEQAADLAPNSESIQEKLQGYTKATD